MDTVLTLFAALLPPLTTQQANRGLSDPKGALEEAPELSVLYPAAQDSRCQTRRKGAAFWGVVIALVFVILGFVGN